MMFNKNNSQGNKAISGKKILILFTIVLVSLIIFTKIMEKKKEREYLNLVDSAKKYMNLKQYENALEKFNLAEKNSNNIEITEYKEEMIHDILLNAVDLKNDGNYESAIDILNIVTKISKKVDVSERIKEIKDLRVVRNIAKAKEEAKDLNYVSALIYLKFDFDLEGYTKTEVDNLIKNYTEKKKFYETSEGERIKEEYLKNRKKKIEAEYRQNKLEEERKEKEERDVELTKRKQEGVLLGMTQEEVLQSSWGKPKDINKTITDYGTREQWVYANYNYLYFEDGILVTIQN